MLDLQKASMWKRISAWLFDGILLVIAAALFAWLISMIVNYDGYVNTLNEKYAEYGQQYGVDLRLPSAEFERLTDAEKSVYENAYAALREDEQALYASGMTTQLMILITTFSILFAFIVMEFTVPMVFGNGQTLGKKIFGIAVMTRDSIRINGKTLFARAILGKYAVGTMIPVYIIMMMSFGRIGVISIIILATLLIAELFMLIKNHTRPAIHDAIAQTVTVDMSSQMIFDTYEDMIAYKQKMHAEAAERSAY